MSRHIVNDPNTNSDQISAYLLLKTQHTLKHITDVHRYMIRLKVNHSYNEFYEIYFL